MKSVRLACWFVLVSTMVLAQSNPTPLVNQPLVPLNAAPGGAGFTLTVNGTGFVAASTVEWNGSPRATTFVSSSQLTATINSADIATAGSFAVTVVNPGPGGGTSNAAYFAVTTPTIGPVFIEYDFTSFGYANVTGDFNGDGKLDLAAAVYAPTGTILVHLGNGDGTFQTASSFATGSNPVSISTGDFNRDGKLDLVTANLNGTTSILLGNGDGSFQPRIDYPTQLQSGGVAVADFDGDGNLDLVVVAQSNSGGVSVLLGNGDGTFHSQVVYPAGKYPYAVAVGDFNQDGTLDLAVADLKPSGGSGGSVAVVLGNGDGTFQRPRIHPLTSAAESIVVADFDGDSKLDLAVGTYFDGVAVLLGKGDGTFFIPQYTTGGCVSAMVAGDFDGDGTMDLACSASYYVSFLLGAGHGTFVSAPGFYANQYSTPLSAGDFNNDGALDVGAGFGVLLQTTATVSETSLKWGKQTVGTASAPKSIFLRNYGGTPLTISSIVTSTNFMQTNTCGSSVPPRRECRIDVSFAPTQTGSLSGTLAITDSAVGSPQVVTLTGTGIAPIVVLSPTSLTFAAQKVGTTSPPQNVTLTNTGTATLQITSIAASGDFAQTNTCGSQILVGQDCTIIVTFTPTHIGTRTGAITIADNAVDTPQTVPLTGTGTP